jgi:hypothetical protein
VVTDVSDFEDVSDFHIDSADKLYNVLRTQVDVVLPSGAAVLNAADPQVVEMADLCDGEVIFYGVDEQLAAIAAHRKEGKRVVFQRADCIVMADGSTEVASLPLSPLVPPEAVLAAIAAGWALGLTPELIGAGLRTFEAAPKKHITERTRTEEWKSYAPAPFAARISGATTLRWKSSSRARRKNNRSPRWPVSNSACARASRHRRTAANRHLRRRAAGARAGSGCTEPASASRLPGHLQPHHGHAGRRHLPDRGRVHRRSGRPPRHGAGGSPDQRRADRHAVRPAAALAELRELDEDVRLGPSTGAIVNAAVARDIPFRRLTEGSMVMFGWGSKQRRIQAAEMDTTGAIGEAIAQDKELTKKLLRPACRCLSAARWKTKPMPGKPRRKSACRWW